MKRRGAWLLCGSSRRTSPAINEEQLAPNRGDQWLSLSDRV